MRVLEMLFIELSHCRASWRHSQLITCFSSFYQGAFLPNVACEVLIASVLMGKLGMLFSPITADKGTAEPVKVNAK